MFKELKRIQSSNGDDIEIKKLNTIALGGVIFHKKDGKWIKEGDNTCANTCYTFICSFCPGLKIIVKDGIFGGEYEN